MVGKSPTGIHGLDEVTQGGLPQGRPTLLCGSAGCGKTLFAMTFLYNGVVEYNEPGVFIAFEERPEDLIKNVGSLNYDIERLIAEKKLAIDHIEIERTKIEESGEYDLEGLFIRLGFAIDFDRRQARRDRHHRDAVQRPGKRAAAALRIAPAVRVAQGEGRHRHHHRRARRGHADALWPGGIRRRLRDPARQPRQRPALDAPPAHRQISRFGARHQRVPVHHRRAGHHRDADHVERSRARCLDRTGFQRHSRSRRDAGRQGLLQRRQHPGVRHGRQRQSRRSARISPIRSAHRASAASISRWKSRRTRSSATCARSASTWKNGSTRSC